MRAVLCLLALLCLGPASALAQSSGSFSAPTYSAASIVNSATNLYGPLAPNTIATLYGDRLSRETRAVTGSDISNNLLPTALAGTGTRILVNGYAAHLYFVSPKQINFLIPSNLRPGNANITLVSSGTQGPVVRLRLRPSSPALYLLDQTTAIATRPDGSVVTASDPARPGDIVILYGTGLGETVPQPRPGEIVRRPAQIRQLDEFALWIGEVEAPREGILYAGLAPGFAGLYQINLRIPAAAADWPEIRIVAGGDSSPGGVHLPVKR